MQKLSWKIVFISSLLILTVILGLFIPTYWQTRSNMESQLSLYMKQNIKLLEQNIDDSIFNILNKFPKSSYKDTLELEFQNHLSLLSANAIFLIKNNGTIISVSGKSINAVKSIMLLEDFINSSEKIINSPLFNDSEGNYYLSTLLKLDNYDLILGISANAEFLSHTAKLRNNMIVFGISVMIFSILLSIVLSKTILHPLEKLTQYATEIGKGRGQKIKMDSRNDEIGFLYKTMVKMEASIKQRSKENKQLVASVSHEIRNPLAGIKINSELLMEESENNPELLGYSKAIFKEANHLSEIVDNFLNYAKPIEANLELVDIREILNEICNNFKSNKINIHGNAKAKVHPGKIQHAFANLIRNAIEVSSDKPIDIEISQTDKIFVKFQNYGPKISVDLHPQIFEAFFSTKESGVGLGLAISKSIVEQHGGNIILVKSDDKGTIFEISLPVIKNEMK